VKNSSILLALLVLCTSVHAAPRSGIEYFPAELNLPTIVCQFGNSEARKFPALSSFEDDWYSKHLHAADEPSLFEQSLTPKSNSGNSYRFTWLGTFHAPVMVRIDENARGQMFLTAKRLTGKGGYEPGRIDKIIQRQLTPAESARLRRALGSGDLAQLKPTPCDRGLDGAVWIVEVRTGETYYVVTRWSPQTGPVRNIGLSFLILTGWDNRPIY